MDHVASVKYTNFVLAEAITALLRRAGLTTRSYAAATTNTAATGYTDDGVLEAAAAVFDTSIYLDDRVREGKYLYTNRSAGGSKVFILREESTLYASLSGDDDLYAPVHAEDDPPMEEEAAVPEPLDTGALGDASGWYYDTAANDFARRTRKQNVFRQTNLAAPPISDDGYGMIIQCPAGKSVVYLEGYGERDMVSFGPCALHENKLAVPLLHVPNGLGICMLNGVTDLVMLDSALNPVDFLKPYDHLAYFVEGLSAEGPVAVVDRPLLTSLQDVVDDDVAGKYRDLRVGDTVTAGECTYDYDALDRGGIPQTSTLGHLKDGMESLKHLVMVVGGKSKLCMSVGNLEQCMRAVDGYLPAGKSVVYGAVERFVQFLYRVGYQGALPAYETFEPLYRMYVNVKLIEDKLRETGGTCKIDMSPFQDVLATDVTYLEFKEWKEEASGLDFYLSD